MNILFIGHEKALNGASKSMLNLIDWLGKNNRIYVLSAFENGPFIDELRKKNISVICEPYYRFRLIKGSTIGWLKKKCCWYLYQNFVNERTAKKVSRWALENHINIIHTNSSVLDIGARIERYSKIPHVCHIREFGDLDFDMYPINSSQNSFQYLDRHTDAFVCISKAISEHYSMLTAEKKYVIYNGVGKENIIGPKSRNWNVARFLIAGRISDAKGQMDAIKACKILYDKGKRNFELWIAGTGKEAIEGRVPKEIHSKVVFLGQIEDMPSLREKTDIELVCSRAEAFGRVTIEAMLAGNPVIGSCAGGTKELIQDGVTGLLYDAGNVANLAQKMETLMDDNTLVLSMGMAAQEYARHNFLIENCANAINDLYFTLYCKHKGSNMVLGG